MGEDAFGNPGCWHGNGDGSRSGYYFVGNAVRQSTICRSWQITGRSTRYQLQKYDNYRGDFNEDASYGRPLTNRELAIDSGLNAVARANALAFAEIYRREQADRDGGSPNVE